MASRLPSMHTVESWVRSDNDDDNYQLWEVVADVRRRFQLEEEDAIRVAHDAVASLLEKEVGELSFGHWTDEPKTVPAERLPPPDDEQWRYPPPDERYWYYSGKG